MKKLVLTEITRIPVTKGKVIRLHGVKEDGSEIYLGREEGFVSLVVQEENEIEVEDK